jgi:hypothetical protein
MGTRIRAALFLSMSAVALSVRSAEGGTFDTLNTGEQPLAETDTLLRSVVPLCGSDLGSDSIGRTSSHVFELCDVQVDESHGRISIDVLVSPSWSYDAIAPETLSDRNKLDRELLSALGFAPAEMSSETVAFAALDQDTRTGENNRAVVTRDHHGSVIRVAAVWPTIDDGIVVAVSDTLYMDYEDAQSLMDRPVLALAPVLVLGPITDGTVLEAVACTQVLFELFGPSGETTPSGFYVFDGVRYFGADATERP